MNTQDHPLRRRYSLELALGIAVLALTAWVLFDSDRSVRKREWEAGSEARSAQPAEFAVPALSETLAREAVRVVAADESNADSRKAPAQDQEIETPESTQEMLEVLVLDASGRPAQGVPIQLELETTPPSRGLGNPAPKTDENGRTRIPLSWFATAERLGTIGERQPRNVLRASVPLEDAPSIDFGPTVPAPGLVTMLLPPAGGVLVRVTEEDGTPVEEGATVYASVRGSTKKASAVNASVREGVAEFPWIDLGTHLELRAVYDDQHTRPSRRARATRIGPRWAGETVEIELTLGSEWPLVTFRVLDERGGALAFANLRLRVDEDPLSPQEASCIADGEGRGELRLLVEHHSPRLRTLDLAMELPVARRAQILLPEELERGQPTDLGAIVLYPSR